jgi:hypothetical protein
MSLGGPVQQFPAQRMSPFGAPGTKFAGEGNYVHRTRLQAGAKGKDHQE